MSFKLIRLVWKGVKFWVFKKGFLFKMWEKGSVCFVPNKNTLLPVQSNVNKMTSKN